MTKQISLDESTLAAIKAHLESGEYNSPDELISASLQLLEKEKGKILALRKAIIEGENSGHSREFDVVAFKTKMKAKYS